MRTVQGALEAHGEGAHDPEIGMREDSRRKWHPSQGKKDKNSKNDHVKGKWKVSQAEGI